MLISHRLWQSHFGSASSAIGRTIMLDGMGYTIAGVLPASFQLAPTADLWMPAGQYGDDLTSHVHHEFTVVGRLRSGIAISRARQQSRRSSTVKKQLRCRKRTQTGKCLWDCLTQKIPPRQNCGLYS